MSYDIMNRASRNLADFVKGGATTTYRLARTIFVIPTSVMKFKEGATLPDKIDNYLGMIADSSSAKQYGYGLGISAGTLFVIGEAGLTIGSFVEDTPVWYWSLAATNGLSVAKELYCFFARKNEGSTKMAGETKS